MDQTANLGTTILVIDDDPDHLAILSTLLKRPDTHGDASRVPRAVRTYTDPLDALADMPAEGPIVVLCDHRMQESTGLEWLPDLTRQELGPVILLSSQGDENIASEAFRQGASDYLTKQKIFEKPQTLGHAIRDAMRRHKLQIKNTQMAKDLKQQNSRLEQQNHRLMELTETAHRFVDNVAHEFRTPLTVIKEFAAIISDGLGGPVSEDQMGYLQHIDASVRDLSQMVDDFLDTSKLRAQRLRVDRQPFDVTEIFDHARKSLVSRAQPKNIEIIEHVAPGLPKAFGDSEKATRAYMNLVTNAIKFSPEFSSVEIAADLSDTGDLEVSVTDHGPGLTQEEIEMISERFRQTNNQRNAGKGFGLGLNIARDLIHLNLGQMHIESTVGQGSTFSFTLPYCDPEHILARYVDLLDAKHGHEDLGPSVSLIHLLPFDRMDSHACFDGFLSGNGKSNDLILHAPSGSGVLLAGISNTPDRWIERLKASWQNENELETNGSNPTHARPLECKWLGTWQLPDGRDMLIQTATHALMEVPSCA